MSNNSILQNIIDQRITVSDHRSGRTPPPVFLVKTLDVIALKTKLVYKIIMTDGEIQGFGIVATKQLPKIRSFIIEDNATTITLLDWFIMGVGGELGLVLMDFHLEHIQN